MVSSNILDIVFILFFVILFIFISILLFFSIKNYFSSNENNHLSTKKKNLKIEELEIENSNFRESLANALLRLSENKIGALIVIENKNDLTYYEQSGYEVNGIFSPEFIMSIFSNKKSALHDGAVIIRDRRIVSISSYLPMTKNIIDVKYGARHRAAIGMSEKTDAIIFVVSETNGNISYAVNGKLTLWSGDKNNAFNEINIIMGK